jgi:hypothetical protein
MIAKAIQYEELLTAIGEGAFGKVEYANESKIILRTADVKTSDLSGTVRVYFNNKREQVMSGRRFDPMGSNLVLLRPGAFYRVYTTIKIVEPIPEGVSALVVLNEDADDVMMITTGPMRTGYVGLIAFTIQPFRRIEIEKMTSIASLMFFEDTVNVPDEWLDSVKTVVLKDAKKLIKATLKNGNSDRGKKSVKTAQAKSKAEKAAVKESTPDADILSDEHPDNPES